MADENLESPIKELEQSLVSAINKLDVSMASAIQNLSSVISAISLGEPLPAGAGGASGIPKSGAPGIPKSDAADGLTEEYKQSQSAAQDLREQQRQLRAAMSGLEAPILQSIIAGIQNNKQLEAEIKVLDASIAQRLDGIKSNKSAVATSKRELEGIESKIAAANEEIEAGPAEQAITLDSQSKLKELTDKQKLAAAKVADQVSTLATLNEAQKKETGVRNSKELEKSITNFRDMNRVLKRVVKAMLDLEQMVRTTQQQFGIAAGQAANLKFSNFIESATSYIESFTSLFEKAAVSQKQIEAAQADFQSQFGGVISSGAAKDLAGQAKLMGVTTAQLAQARRVFMTQTMGNLTDANAAQTKFIGEFVKKGLTSKDAMEFIGKNSELIARNGGRFASSLTRAAAEAKKIGVDLSKVDQFGDSIIGNFEGFLENMAEVSAMGFDFDTSRLAQLAESGDTGALFTELKSELAAQGKNLTTLRRSEQLALSNAFGMSIEEFQRMASGKEGSGESMEDLQKASNKLLERAVNALDPISALLKLIIFALGVRAGVRAIPLLRGALPAAGTTAAVGTAAAARVGGSALSGLGSAAKFGGRLLGKAALPLAAVMSLYDAFQGFNADKNATTGQKVKNAGSSALSGLTFGLLGKSASEIKEAGLSASAPTIADTVKTTPPEVGTLMGTNAVSAVGGNPTDAKTTAVAPIVKVDLSILEAKLDSVIRAINSMEISMDGTKVGKVIANAEGRAQIFATVSALRT